MKRIIKPLLIACGVFFSMQIFAQSVFINEIHYQNSGDDLDEAIEIFGPANTNLSGWSLVFYEGFGGTSYMTHQFGNADVTTDEADVNGQRSGVLLTNFGTEIIQNGDTQGAGVALINSKGSVEHFISYRGSFTAIDGPANGVNSVDIGVMESESSASGGSLRMGAKGWSVETVSTFGALNPLQPETPTDLGGNVATVEECEDCQQWNGPFNTEGSIYRTGNVGIGTTTAPSQLLTLAHPTKPVLRFERSMPSYWDAEMFLTSGGNLEFHGGGSGTGSGLGFNMKLSGRGDLYIDRDFYINGDKIQASSATGAFSIYGNEDSQSGPYINMFGPQHGSEANRLSLFAGAGGDIKFYNRTATGGFQHNMVITKEGNVGIGTNSVPSGFSLAVDNGIITEEVKVELCGDGGWCDYVFEKEYDLKSLSEVKTHIAEFGHLPNIPSSATVEGNGGFELKDMTIRQMEKIEELFLHVIELEEKIEALQEKLEEK